MTIEFRDIILFATALISGFNLYYIIKGRKNALREHVYKEQLAIFRELSEAYAILSNLFDDVEIEGELIDEVDDKIDKQINKIFALGDASSFLIPNKIFTSINKAERAADILL